MSYTVTHLFPNLPFKPWQHFDLNDTFLHSNVLINPRIPSEQENLIPNETYTYGGFGEDRKDIWDGFEEKASRMVHLGIDINGLPVGQAVSTLVNGKVVFASHDNITFNGWGGRVIIHETDNDRYWLFGHLYQPSVKVGDNVFSGQIIGYLAPSSLNGGWFVHLHLQIMTSSFVDSFSTLEEIDGYDFEKIPDGVIDPLTLILF